MLLVLLIVIQPFYSLGQAPVASPAEGSWASELVEPAGSGIWVKKQLSIKQTAFTYTLSFYDNPTATRLIMEQVIKGNARIYANKINSNLFNWDMYVQSATLDLKVNSVMTKVLGVDSCLKVGSIFNLLSANCGRFTQLKRQIAYYQIIFLAEPNQLLMGFVAGLPNKESARPAVLGVYPLVKK